MTNQETDAAPTYDAARISPVPRPGSQTAPPEPYRGIYPMPMFMTLTSADLGESERFWTEGLGFISLYAMPGTMIHLRRWAFQDILIHASRPGANQSQPVAGTAGSLSLAVAESQIADMVAACERLRPGSTVPAVRKPWNSMEARVATPEGLTLTLTAALPVDTAQAEAYLRGHGR
ncbi:VOC family protein [Bifidobacterium xylocopae]|uniref:Glycosyltransferase n=1 Tax=Bifidobacterium xylocopae TaxID=2493119 RepID=A0A366KGG7_9BIFI|nr:VOC family protein [Bifidobacterium xylocopae]RBP99781.1 glycosyltransferase [Bifidobacterium xylocopae]